MKFSQSACISQKFILSRLYTEKTSKLILNSNHPEGYYERLSLEKKTVKEHHLFLIVKQEISCFQDRVFRTISFYEKRKKISVNAFPGRIMYKNNLVSCIRFRESEFDILLDLIPDFRKREIEFVEAKKTKFEPYESIVQFKKNIDAEEIQQNIFQDTNNKKIYYLPIADDIEFDFFKKLMIYIRNNCDFKTFDASLVYSLDKNYIVHDYAMIYSPNCQIERLSEFDDKLAEAMKEVKRI